MSIDMQENKKTDQEYLNVHGNWPLKGNGIYLLTIAASGRWKIDFLYVQNVHAVILYNDVVENIED